MNDIPLRKFYGQPGNAAALAAFWMAVHWRERDNLMKQARELSKEHRTYLVRFARERNWVLIGHIKQYRRELANLRRGGGGGVSKSTEGPWEIVEPFGNGEYVKIIGGIDGDAHDDGTPYMTSTHVCDVIDNQDEEANARLIAAAPDLLALAKQYASECTECDGKGRRALGLSGYKEPCPDCADIRTVIAKAEGRS